MFYLLLLLLYLSYSKSDLNIKDVGTSSPEEGDIALIFYVTLENISGKDLDISVSMVQCCENVGKEEGSNCKTMYLIGGDMGILYCTYTKNVTLIFPNMYLQNREGSCTVEIRYQNENFVKTMVKDIKFSTKKSDELTQCNTADLDASKNCMPVDCTMKYSGEKSFFNPTTNQCESVPSCVNDPTTLFPDVAYSPTTNNCSYLNDSMNKCDLETLETNQADTSEEELTVLINTICHHGDLDPNSQCFCHADWKTNLDEDEDDMEHYQPNLMQYHMCNIETSGWNKANQSKLKTTGLIIAILAITVASKIIILMCILNWCYKAIRKDGQDRPCGEEYDAFDESLIMCEDFEGTEQRCICRELTKAESPVMSFDNEMTPMASNESAKPPMQDSETPKPVLYTETVNVAYYPAVLSTDSSVKFSAESEHPRQSKQSTKSDRSIVMSRTTSSVGISFQSETEGTTDETEDTDASEDYDIQFYDGQGKGGAKDCTCECECVVPLSDEVIRCPASPRADSTRTRVSQRKSRGSTKQDDK